MRSCRWSGCLSVFVLLGLSACATLPGPQPVQPDWQVQGRAVLQVDGQRHALRFRAWRQQARLQMEILAPMGQGRWQLGRDETGLWLQDAHGLRLQGAAVNHWLREQTGFSIRLSDWFAWLRNQTAASLPAGWNIRVAAPEEKPHCPSRIDLEGAQGRLVILLKQWQGDCG